MITVSTQPRAAVSWARVGVFYGIALGGSCLVAAGMRAAGALMDGKTSLTLIVGAAAMIMPMIAGLFIERGSGRPTHLVAGWTRWRHGWRRRALRVLAAAGIAYAMIVLLSVLIAWLGDLSALPGVGRFGSALEVAANLRRLQPSLPADLAMPPAAMLASSVVNAVLAGLTLSGLLAFGEEYGWRGVLADELRPLGFLRANLITGVLWGFWHAPLIMLGLNYGTQWAWGIPVMITWTVPMSFVLAWVREQSGSVVAAAVLHGAFNAFVGVYVLVLVGANRLIGLPVGLAMSVVMTLVALALTRVRPSPLDVRGQAT